MCLGGIGVIAAFYAATRYRKPRISAAGRAAALDSREVGPRSGRAAQIRLHHIMREFLLRRERHSLLNNLWPPAPRCPPAPFRYEYEMTFLYISSVVKLQNCYANIMAGNGGARTGKFFDAL